MTQDNIEATVTDQAAFENSYLCVFVPRCEWFPFVFFFFTHQSPMCFDARKHFTLQYVFHMHRTVDEAKWFCVVCFTVAHYQCSVCRQFYYVISNEIVRTETNFHQPILVWKWNWIYTTLPCTLKSNGLYVQDIFWFAFKSNSTFRQPMGWA